MNTIRKILAVLEQIEANTRAIAMASQEHDADEPAQENTRARAEKVMAAAADRFRVVGR